MSSSSTYCSSNMRHHSSFIHLLSVCSHARVSQTVHVHEYSSIEARQCMHNSAPCFDTVIPIAFGSMAKCHGHGCRYGMRYNAFIRAARHQVYGQMRPE